MTPRRSEADLTLTPQARKLVEQYAEEQRTRLEHELGRTRSSDVVVEADVRQAMSSLAGAYLRRVEHSSTGDAFGLALFLMATVLPALVVALVTGSGASGAVELVTVAAAFITTGISFGLSIVGRNRPTSRSASLAPSFVLEFAALERTMRGAAGAGLGSASETASLTAVVAFLTQTQLWLTPDVASFQAVLKIRNRIVHSPAAAWPNVDEIGTGLVEIQRLRELLDLIASGQPGSVEIDVRDASPHVISITLPRDSEDSRRWTT